MPTSGQVIREIIQAFAPRHFAMEGDKTGLQVGTLQKDITNILTTLDTTQDVVQEAVDNNVDLIISHHAVVFRPLSNLRTDDPKGKLLETLIKNNIAVYVPHTAMDITDGGINDELANIFQLQNTLFLKETGSDSSTLLATCNDQHNIQSLECVHTRKANSRSRQINKEAGTKPYSIPIDSHNTPRGIGRIGTRPQSCTLTELADEVLDKLDAPFLRIIGDPNRTINKVALLCGDGNRFLHNAKHLGADVLITGDVYYHTALEARALGIALLDPGHNATERVVTKLWKNVIDKALAKRKIEGINVLTSQVHTEPFTIHNRTK